MSANDRSHRLRRMTGRDPHEAHRAATPLELLDDLTLVVAFSLAGSQFAHALVEVDVARAGGGEERLVVPVGHQAIVRPPSTGIIWPVT